MKLSEYATREGITYRSAWERFRKGNVPGAYVNDSGHIVVPSPTELLHDKAVIYARVSTHKQKDDLERQSTRLQDFAISRGFEVVEVVEEIGSGVNSSRPKLTKLLHHHEHWGTLIVEHRDRLTRVGFELCETLLTLMSKDILVANHEESDEGRVDDILSLMYCFAASEYGKRGAQHRALRAVKALEQE